MIPAVALAGCLTIAITAGAQDQAPSQYPQEKPSAQNPEPPPPPLQAAPPQGAPPPVAGEMREWVPVGIGALGRNAGGRTEFTLDHSMLVLVSKLDRDNEDLRRVIAGVNAVSVHSFHFPGGVSVDPAAMMAIRQQHREAGFQQLVSRHRGQNGVVTDLWLRMEGSAIRDVAVLWVGARDVNFVSVSGSITPLDLLHLSGHFGIPKMDGGAVVPLPPQ